MKKDLSILAKELFPDLTQKEYEELLSSYQSGYCKETTPKLTLTEAIDKYTAPVLNVFENKNNWENRSNTIYVNFYNVLDVFDEFFPVYKSEDGKIYLDIGVRNDIIGEKIVCLLISNIFYLNYTGMEIRDIFFFKEKFLSERLVRIILRLSDKIEVKEK